MLPLGCQRYRIGNGEIGWLGVLVLGGARASFNKIQVTRGETLRWIIVSLSSPAILMLNSSQMVSENA